MTAHLAWLITTIYRTVIMGNTALWAQIVAVTPACVQMLDWRVWKLTQTIALGAWATLKILLNQPRRLLRLRQTPLRPLKTQSKLRWTLQRTSATPLKTVGILPMWSATLPPMSAMWLVPRIWRLTSWQTTMPTLQMIFAMLSRLRSNVNIVKKSKNAITSWKVSAIPATVVRTKKPLWLKWLRWSMKTKPKPTSGLKMTEKAAVRLSWVVLVKQLT